MNLQILRNLELFEELITCGRNVYFWIYDCDLNLVHSNCLEQKVLNLLFAHSSKNTVPAPPLHGTWASEQAILKMIEEGNLNYRKQQDKLGQIGHVGKLSNGEPLRQYKNQIISFIVLSTRAAIRGGLSPETAYTLSDLYIQNVESSNSLTELATVSYTMQEDFVQRVHQCKIETSISPHIKKCRDYIQLHITEKINLKELAAYIGYSQNYLCKKFKEETGTNIRDYINEQKIERSKDLLVSTTCTVLDISEIMHFSSPSYYCELFHELTGLTPNEYRNQKP